MLPDPHGMPCRAILPVPGAFAQTGAVCSTLFMVLTAAANVYTSDLLFWQANATRRHNYESLSIATGGRCILKVGFACTMRSGLRLAPGLHQRSAVAVAQPGQSA